MTNSSCSRTCPRRDSTHPWWVFSKSSRWAQACCWSSQTQLLRDFTLCSCFNSSALAWVSKCSPFPSRTDFATFAGWASLKTDSLLLETSAVCSLFLWKFVLSQSILMWEPCMPHVPCADQVQTLRWTGHQVFSFRVINLRSFRTCFTFRQIPRWTQQSTNLFVVQVCFLRRSKDFNRILSRREQWLVIG